MLGSLLAGAIAMQSDWSLTCEKTKFRQTGTYAEAVDFCRRLDAASPEAQVIQFGTSPEGRPMIALVLSRDRTFTPAGRQKSKRPLIFIQNGIHSGEIEGKDASLILAREILITKERAALLDRVNIIIVPVYSCDAHERRSKYNRANQNGPEEMGWRATSQNFNLNRDYVKVDGGETQALLPFLNDWDPDFFIDNHTTDGGDWQYIVQWDVPAHPGMDSAVVEASRALVADVMPKVDRDGFLTAPYFGGIDPANPERGIRLSAFGPRYSTGYQAAWNRVSLLVETHVLKPYEPRVWGTHSINRHAIEWCGANAAKLVGAREQARKAAAALKASDKLTISAKNAGTWRPWTFKGFRFDPYQSEISGGQIPRWTKEPTTVESRIADTFVPDVSVELPAAYLVPRSRTDVLELLRLHRVKTTTLKFAGGERTLSAEVTVFADVKFAARPFESRFSPSFVVRREPRQIIVRDGAVLVPVNQPAIRLIATMFEPDAEDSLVRWGQFNAIFEEKEYAEAYAMEPIAKRMLETMPGLQAEFDERLKDSAFAGNPAARLRFFYERSPYFDKAWNVHPIVRLTEAQVRELQATRSGSAE